MQWEGFSQLLQANPGMLIPLLCACGNTVIRKTGRVLTLPELNLLGGQTHEQLNTACLTVTTQNHPILTIKQHLSSSHTDCLTVTTQNRLILTIKQRLSSNWKLFHTGNFY